MVNMPNPVQPEQPGPELSRQDEVRIEQGIGTPFTEQIRTTGAYPEIDTNSVAQAVHEEKSRRSRGLHPTGNVRGEPGTPSGQDISVQLANQDPSATVKFDRSPEGDQSRQEALRIARQAETAARLRKIEESEGKPNEKLAATKTIVINARQRASK